MKKLRRKPRPARYSVSFRKGNLLQLWYARSPILTSGALLILVIALAGTSYGAYSYLQPKASDSNLTNQEGVSQEGELSDATSDIADDNKADSIKEGSETENYGRNEYGQSKMTGAGCITCDNNPDHSIITNFKSQSMRTNTTIGPFTARTSNGAKVYWSLPASSKDWSPYSYTNSTTNRDLSSITFYIRAESNVKPGKYELQMTAIDGDQSTRARHFATITVLEKGHFTITAGPATIVDISGYHLRLPLQLNRFKGHVGSVDLEADLSCPANSNKYFSQGLYDSNPVIKLVRINNFSVPATCSIAIDAHDDNGVSFKKTLTFSVD